jgi:hypothetical protein
MRYGWTDTAKALFSNNGIKELLILAIIDKYNYYIRAINKCYGSGIPCHVVTCTSVVTSGVERQNSVFIYEPNLVNNFFLL